MTALAATLAVEAPSLVVESTVVVSATVLARRLVRPALERRRRRHAIEEQLPDAIDLLVLAIHAGLAPVAAIREVATTARPPVGDGFAEVARQLDRGRPFDEAVGSLRHALGAPADGLVDVVTTTTRYGLPLEPVLDQLTAEARDARRRRHQANARRLPIRLSLPLVACTLPSFVLLAIAPAVIAALSSLGPPAW